MILWFTGSSGAGKTTAAKKIAEQVPGVIVLDGDELRSVWPGLGFSQQDRWEQNRRVARLARLLEQQGFVVLVSVICPYEKLRQEVRAITRCRFVYVPGGIRAADHPYEIPEAPDFVLDSRSPAAGTGLRSSLRLPPWGSGPGATPASCQGMPPCRVLLARALRSSAVLRAPFPFGR